MLCYNLENNEIKEVYCFFMCTIVLFILINSIIIFSFLKISLSDNSGLYFFSSWLQANAAIFALYSIFLIFKIQYIQSSINSIIGILSNNPQSIAPKTILDFDTNDINERNKILEDKSGTRLHYPLVKWNDFIEEKNKIKSKIILPIILLSLGMVLDGLGLIFSNELHCFITYELIVLSNVLFFHFITIFIIVLKIIRILNDNKKPNNSLEVSP